MGGRDDTEGLSLDQCPKAEEILETVDKILREDSENIVLLEEIPYMCSPIREGNKRELYRRFEEKLNEKGYQIIPQAKKARSCTIAVVNKNSDWSLEPRSTFMEDYQNRFVTVRHERTGLLVLGLHAIAEDNKWYRPKEVKAFFNRLQNYAGEHAQGKTVILGDMNVHSEEPCNYYKIFHSICTEVEKDGLGYMDLIPDSTETYFPCHTTIDHVLVSAALKGKATARVYPKEELCLSDHAVIVVDIQV